MMDDYYGEDGCCLTCEDRYPGCLCEGCKCTQCDWYEEEDVPDFDQEGIWKTGRCTYKKPAFCKGCSKQIYWKKDPINGRWIPENFDGTVHKCKEYKNMINKSRYFRPP